MDTYALLTKEVSEYEGMEALKLMNTLIEHHPVNQGILMNCFCEALQSDISLTAVSAEVAAPAEDFLARTPQIQASRVLVDFAYQKPSNQKMIYNDGRIIPLLCELLRSGEASLVGYVARSLAFIAWDHPESRAKICEIGAIPVLKSLSGGGTVFVNVAVSLALKILADDPSAHAHAEFSTLTSSFSVRGVKPLKPGPAASSRSASAEDLPQVRQGEFASIPKASLG